MNFENMPELKWTYGYFLVIGVIPMICAWLHWRFRRNHWLRRYDLLTLIARGRVVETDGNAPLLRTKPRVAATYRLVELVPSLSEPRSGDHHPVGR
jgi:hypothetical protein